MKNQDAHTGVAEALCNKQRCALWRHKCTLIQSGHIVLAGRLADHKVDLHTCSVLAACANYLGSLEGSLEYGDTIGADRQQGGTRGRIVPLIFCLRVVNQVCI